jgi:hypothetical protein
MAPSHRLPTGLVLGVLGVASAVVLLRLDIVSTSAGSLAAAVLVALWFHPRRQRQTTRWVLLGTGGLFLAFVGLVHAHYSDRPARQDALPAVLSHVLSTNAAGVTAFYLYDRGGFIDTEWLWRIDATPDVVTAIVAGLQLRPVPAVPHDFWRMPPHYWPRARPAGALAYQSRSFSADQRGPDGSHYFLLHDKTQDRAYVWVKDNF